MSLYDSGYVLKEVGRCDIVREYPYFRDAKLVADYLNGAYIDKKLLFYGDGGHTAEVLKHINGDMVVGVVETLDKKADYIGADIGCDLYRMSEINSLQYDFLVLLGYWREDAVSSFVLDNNLASERVLVAYKEKCIQTYSKERISKELAGKIGFASDRKRVALILRGERRDYITACSYELQKRFSLTKIYLGDVVNERNEWFENVIVCNGEYSYLPILFDEYSFDMVIFFICGQSDNGIGLCIKDLVGGFVKFVTINCEMALDGFFNCSREVLREYYFNGDDRAYEINRYAETALMHDSDGFIANIGGSYFENVISKQAKNGYFCKAFLSNSELSFVRSDKEHAVDKHNISIVYVGSVVFDSKNGIFSSIVDFTAPFGSVLFFNEHVSIHVYNLHVTDLPEVFVEMVGKRLFVHQRIPHSSVPSEISKMDYGFMWVNLNDTSRMALRYTFDSFFHAKFMSYVAAALPVIVLDELTILSNIVKDKKIGIVLSQNELAKLDEILLNVDYDELRDNMDKYRAELVEENHPALLSEYLKKIVNTENIC